MMDARVEETTRQSESGKVFEATTDLPPTVSSIDESVPCSTSDFSAPVSDTGSLAGKKSLERSSLSPRSSCVDNPEFPVDRGEPGQTAELLPDGRATVAATAILETRIPAARTGESTFHLCQSLEQNDLPRTVLLENPEAPVPGATSQSQPRDTEYVASVHTSSGVHTPGPQLAGASQSVDGLRGLSKQDSVGDAKSVTRSFPEGTSRQSTAGSPVEVRFPVACGQQVSPASSRCAASLSGAASNEDGAPFSRAAPQMERLEENCGDAAATPAPLPSGSGTGAQGPCLMGANMQSPSPNETPEDEAALADANLQAGALPASTGGSEEAFGATAWRKNASDRDTSGTHSTGGEKEEMKEEKVDYLQSERIEDNGEPTAPAKRRKKEDEDDRFSLGSTFPAPAPPANASAPSAQVNAANSQQVFHQGTACHAPGWAQAPQGPLQEEEQAEGSDGLAAPLSPGQSCPPRGGAVAPGRVPVAGEKYAQWLDAIYTVCLKIDDLCAKLDPEFPNAMALWEQRGPGIDGARSLFVNGGCPGGYGSGGVDPTQRAFDNVNPGDASPPFGVMGEYSTAGSHCTGMYSLGGGTPAHASTLPGSGAWAGGAGSLKKRGRKDRPPTSRPGAAAASPPSSLLSSSLFGPRGASGGLVPLSTQGGQAPHLGSGAASMLHQLQGRDTSQLLGASSLSNDMFVASQRPPQGPGAGNLGAGARSSGAHAGLGATGANSGHGAHFLPHLSSQLSPTGRERVDPAPAAAPESEYEYLLHLPEQEGPNPENATDLKCDVAGVYWDKRSWIASWYEGGKRYYKSFSAKTHGFYRSKYWAIKVRLSKVQNSNLLVNKGAKNKDRGSSAAAHSASAGGYGRNQVDDSSGYR
ncbi:AP2 domain transcription factor AP2XI-5 [Toxoplasma gondii CAST]|uniref:AP2 domain transcription factor AP2XI-5 n=1 Tax=Toxoplasma gondii CAST TaxID=943122 RepID=A0A425HN05_TOXGO|nr:AP2 domain transcription factor AP2XI-5 [Toxoplasma gondii CAST]